MNHYCQLLAAFTGSAGFALAYHFRGTKPVLAAGFGGFAGWLCYLAVFDRFGSAYLAAYLGTILVSVYSEAAARVLRTPATGFLIVTAIPMIPGASLYRSMYHLLLSETNLFQAEIIDTVLFASCMAAGFVTTAVLVHLISAAKETG